MSSYYYLPTEARDQVEEIEDELEEIEDEIGQLKQRRDALTEEIAEIAGPHLDG